MSNLTLKDAAISLISKNSSKVCLQETNYLDKNSEKNSYLSLNLSLQLGLEAQKVEKH
jgi:hypothetical protein